MWLIALVLDVPIAVTVNSPFAGLWALLVGVAVPTVRIVIWKRRHPQITLEQYLNERRRNAPWN